MRSFAGNQGLTGKVDRFQSLSAKAAKTMPELQPVTTEVDVHRLSGVLQTTPDSAQNANLNRHPTPLQDTFAAGSDAVPDPQATDSTGTCVTPVSSGMADPAVSDQSDQAASRS
ncbi:hypothetical protein [Advenella kashmirensis]|uniref:hypothetical protein n=1 Tax=Advenella kashmirensis TaxID=310575 RepID=UPI000683628B|nr:hypothetical protein [Advenella kashmirensis]